MGPDKRKKITEVRRQGKKLKLDPKPVMDLYVDLDPGAEEKGKGGRPADPFLSKLRVLCYLKEDTSQARYYRCSGASKGCKKLWLKKSGFRERILAHAARCRHLPSNVKQEVNKRFGHEALGKQFRKDDASDTEKDDNNTGSDQEADQASSVVSGLSRGSSLMDLARKAGRTDFNNKVNFAILKLICVRGIPPTIVDSIEWKALLSTAAPSYQHSGSKTFVDSLIPREYAYIKDKQLEHLKKCANLTISFDGGTTAGLQSVYTVHVITPQRRVFFGGRERGVH